MTKSVGIKELESAAGGVVDDVLLRGDRFVIERQGIPVAAIVPVHVLRALDRGRDRLLALMEEVGSRNAGTPEEELDAAIEEGVRSVRAERRRGGAHGRSAL